MTTSNHKPVLTVEDLSVSFRSRHRQQEFISNVVKKVSFNLHAGETLALVGESGSGKSLTALSILQLLPYPQAFHPSGSVRYQDTEMVGASRETLQRIRGNDISMIFQEPMTALNPLHVIQKQIAESLALHQGISGDAARTKIVELLNQVGIHDPETRLGAYPHQLSGGQRQRVMIAMALANLPEVLLADEPTTALDVTVQARILALLKELHRSNNLGILLITHDLNLVRKVADRVLVMQDGRMVERGPTTQIFQSAKEEYTRILLSAEPPDRDPPEPGARGDQGRQRRRHGDDPIRGPRHRGRHRSRARGDDLRALHPGGQLRHQELPGHRPRSGDLSPIGRVARRRDRLCERGRGGLDLPLHRAIRSAQLVDP